MTEARSSTTHTGTKPQRRHLTVLFCDLVNSTGLSRDLDPEDYVNAILHYRNVVCDIVVKFDGFVASFFGDGILAYFGYPLSQEDNAERSLRAAIKIIGDLQRTDRQSWPELKARLGIASGTVVAGDLVGHQFTEVNGIAGDVPNLAARLQEIAGPNGIAVCDETRRLAGEYFDWERLERVTLKGYGENSAWRVLGLREPKSRFDVSHRSGMAPLVGRDSERYLLQRRWRQVLEGEGQAVILCGDAGIGKSRLLLEFRKNIVQKDNLRIIFLQCSPFHSSDSLYPILQWLLAEANIDAAYHLRQVDNKLRKLFGSGLKVDTQTWNWFIAYFATADSEEETTSIEVPDHRERVLSLLIQWMRNAAADRPLLILVEDVHWADATTHLFLDSLIAEIPHLRALLLVTSRSLTAFRGSIDAYVTILTLNALTRHESLKLVGYLTGSLRLSSSLTESIVEESDCIPLFVEELTHAVSEVVAQGDPADNPDELSQGGLAIVPHTLHDSLMSRLDRMREERDVLEAAAVIGRDVSYRLLLAVTKHDEGVLRQYLHNLVEAGFLRQRTSTDGPSYRFRQALIRDVAYASILKARRRRLHSAVAASLEELYAPMCQMSPARIAEHHFEAGNIEKAVEYWQRAGTRAVQRCAIREAHTLIGKALRALGGLGSSRERDLAEIRLRVLLGRVYNLEESWADPRVQHEYKRALELCTAHNEVEQSIPVRWALATSHLLAGRIDIAAEEGSKNIALARQTGNPDLITAALSGATMYEFYRGNFETVLKLSDEAIDTYREEAKTRFQVTYGADRRGQAIRSCALALFCLGNVADAITADKAQRSQAEQSGNNYEIAYSWSVSCLLCTLMHDFERALMFGKRIVDVATSEGYKFRMLRAQLFVLLNEAYARTSRGAVQDFEYSLEEHKRTGTSMGHSALLAALAELWSRVGEDQRAWDCIQRGIDYVESSGERFAEAELHRVGAAILLKAGRTGEAEQAYRRALATAQSQHARMWQLRAAHSLAELYVAEDSLATANEVLGTAVDSFRASDAFPELESARSLRARIAAY